MGIPSLGVGGVAEFGEAIDEGGVLRDRSIVKESAQPFESRASQHVQVVERAFLWIVESTLRSAFAEVLETESTGCLAARIDPDHHVTG